MKTERVTQAKARAMLVEKPNGASISFFVPGIPKPAGSKRAFVNQHTGRATIVDACKGSRDWKTTVSGFAMQAMLERANGTLFDGPLSMMLTFQMPRPKSHYGTGKRSAELKAGAPLYHVIRPDATKLTRAVEDALTGIVWRDDSQVVEQHILKSYSERPGVLVAIKTIETDGTRKESAK